MSGLREEVAAQGYAARRRADALARGEHGGPPRAALDRAAVVGAVLAGVGVAALSIVGLLAPARGGRPLPTTGVVLDDRGGTYVMTHGRLHPVLNLASARLLGGPGAVRVDARAVRRARLGPPVGIPGAPDALPDPADLTTASWTACSAALAPGSPQSVTVRIGGPGARAPDGSALSTVTPDGTRWLVAGGRRLRVDPGAAVLLGLTASPAAGAAPQLLALLPSGPDVVVPHLAGAGTRPRVPLPFAARIGDLVRAAGLEFVVTGDGLAAVDPFSARLLEATAGRVRAVTARDLLAVPVVARPVELAPGWPHALPQSVQAAPRGLCVSWSAAGGVGPVAAAAGGPVLHPGAGALIRTATGFALVTDSGLRYPVADAEALTRLGYDPRAARAVPDPVSGLLPAGPELSVRAAAATFAGRRQTDSAG